MVRSRLYRFFIMSTESTPDLELPKCPHDNNYLLSVGDGMSPYSVSIIPTVSMPLIVSSHSAVSLSHSPALHSPTRSPPPAVPQPQVQPIFAAETPSISHCNTTLFTFAPRQPHRKASSWANISPNPSMTPLIKGRMRLIAVVRRRESNVGGL